MRWLALGLGFGGWSAVTWAAYLALGEPWVVAASAGLLLLVVAAVLLFTLVAEQRERDASAATGRPATREARHGR